MFDHQPAEATRFPSHGSGRLLKSIVLCQDFNQQRTLLLGKVSDVLSEIGSNINDLSQCALLNILLYGDSRLTCTLNRRIISATLEYILETGRMNWAASLLSLPLSISLYPSLPSLFFVFIFIDLCSPCYVLCLNVGCRGDVLVHTPCSFVLCKSCSFLV